MNDILQILFFSTFLPLLHYPLTDICATQLRAPEEVQVLELKVRYGHRDNVDDEAVKRG